MTRKIISLFLIFLLCSPSFGTMQSVKGKGSVRGNGSLHFETGGSPPPPVSDLTILTAALTPCENGIPCSNVLVGANGDRSDLYNWSITSGSLPPGVVLDDRLGAIYGVPTANGTYNFTVRVTDSSLNQATANLSLSVSTHSCSGTAITGPVKLTTGNTTYCVTQSFNCAESCIGIAANNITIDLNGKTLVYNTSGTAGNAGILDSTCAVQTYPVDADWCGGGSTLTVKNGFIEESSASAIGSSGVRMGQGGMDVLTVKNVQFITRQSSSSPIHTLYTTGPHIISSNVFYNASPTPDNRHQMRGYSIRREAGTPGYTESDTIEDNTFIGFPQGGIYFQTGLNTTIRRNAFRGTSDTTNGFAIDLATPAGGQVYQNVVDCYYNGTSLVNIPVVGWTPKTAGCRGILANSGSLSGASQLIHDNMVVAREVSRNVEYGGCVAGGSYGVQMENASRNVKVYNNMLKVMVDECSGDAVRHSVDTPLAQNNLNEVYGNRLFAVRVGATTKYAKIFGQVNSEWIYFHDNYMWTDWMVSGNQYEGSTNKITWLNNTIVKGTNPSPNWALFGKTDACDNNLDNNDFINNTYSNGAADSTNFTTWNHSCAGAGDWSKYRYAVQWTYTLQVINGAGGAVEVRDALNNLLASYNIGSNEFAQSLDPYNAVRNFLVFTDYTRENSDTQVSIVTSKNPYNITITKAGCSSQNFSRTFTSALTETRTLSCP